MNPPNSFSTHEHSRPSYIHTPSLGSSTFSVAGMPGPSGSQLASSTWGPSAPGGGFGASLSDPLSQTRPHYTQGYLMSMSQSASPQQNNQRHDEPPLVQTRAKISSSLSRSSALDFGKESMFQSSRQRPALTDEDAPPTMSVNDIVDDFRNAAPNPSLHSQGVLRQSTFQQSARSSQPVPQVTSQPIYVIVFGYPPDKYTITVEYFRSLGDSTEPDPNTDVTNCFRIGYRDPGAAMRAIRKNGEVLGGSWMVGTKWADPGEAELIFGSAVFQAANSPYLASGSFSGRQVASTHILAPAMDEDEVISDVPGAGALVPATVTVGTPLKLAPSTSAFRRPGSDGSTRSTVVPTASGQTAGAYGHTVNTPGKGVLGQVSDLIFGW